MKYLAITMQFLAYAAPEAIAIVKILRTSGYRLEENTGLCRKSNIFGYTDLPKSFVLCTTNIKRGGWDMKKYITETIIHEAVHAAQICNHSEPLGISKSRMPLPSNKLQDIKNSVAATRSSKIVAREHEAYYLEDKPQEVARILKKYCL